MHARKTLTSALALASIASIALSGLASAASTLIYDNIPNPTPGNVSSQAFQATQTSQVGDRIAFTGTSRAVTGVTVLMSSWGCESGHWTSGDCLTAAGATFNHPITLNIYQVGTANAPGALITTITQTFAIPYRPSASGACTGANTGKWFDAASATCFNGLATPITFSVPNVLVPDQVIVGIAYNTSNYGAAPIGPAPCASTAAGCGYDSLNVGLSDPATNNPPGSNPAPNDAYLDSETAGQYCDGGAGGTGTFRLDPGAGCWTGFKPAIEVRAALPTPASNDACKDGGWASLYRADGTTFKNQGDCIQYVNSGK